MIAKRYNGEFWSDDVLLARPEDNWFGSLNFDLVINKDGKAIATWLQEVDGTMKINVTQFKDLLDLPSK